MAKWLLKTEPSVYSYADLVRDKKAVWDGVTSPWAMPYIRQVKPGDLAFIYHTGEEKQVIGIAEITSVSYPDPKNEDSEFLQVFDIKPKSALKNPVTLAQVKADKRFKASKLVTNPRLSVQPVSDDLWKGIMELSEKGDVGISRTKKSKNKK